MMNKLINLILLIGMLSMGSGCAVFKNPFKSWTKATTKVEDVQKKVDNNQDQITDQGKNYVYATKLALQADPSTNQYHQVETQLNDKAVATLGTPTMDQIVMLEAMVKNLLSTNQELVAKGQKQLAKQDEIVANLQEDNKNLQTKLDTANKKLVDVGTANSGLAQKWNNLVKFFWYFVYLIIFVVVIKILAVVLPPPYNSIVGIIALPIGLFTKLLHALVPEAKAIAGVVAAEYKTGTQDLVTTIQKLKEAHPELRHEITAAVIANTDSNTSAIAINKAKSDLGIVS
jgi:hypothetical protein